jgi:hypothetical protein
MTSSIRYASGQPKTSGRARIPLERGDVADVENASRPEREVLGLAPEAQVWRVTRASGEVDVYPAEAIALVCVGPRDEVGAS